MGRGGSQVGSGRKPFAGSFVPHVHAGGVTASDSGVSALPPEDLPVDQRAFWQRNAQRAIDQGALTPDTLEGFRLLCRLEGLMRKRAAIIEKDGETYLKVVVDGSGQEHQELKAHPLMGPHDRIAKQVETLLARYKLAAFGKPEVRQRPKTQANPFASIGRR